MKTKENEEFNALFLKVSQNKLSLDYLDEVVNFPQLHDGLYDVEDMEYKCNNLISLMYSQNGFPEKSLSIDLELLEKTPDSDSGYFAIINGAIASSAELNRTDEVLPFAITYLKNQDDSFYGKLPVLKWYIEHYPKGENGSFTALEPILTAIALKMGATVDKLQPFPDRVLYLYEDFSRAAAELDQFRIRFKRTSQELREGVVKEYLEKENLKWFKDYVIQYYVT